MLYTPTQYTGADIANYISCYHVSVEELHDKYTEGYDSNLWLEAVQKDTSPLKNLAFNAPIILNSAEIVKGNTLDSIKNLAPSIYKRLNSLSKVENGWDGEDAKSMSLVSLNNLKLFFSSLRKIPESIGVFLGYDGEIIINWPIGNNKLVDVYFHNDIINVVVDDMEYDFKVNEASSFVERYT